MEPAGRREQCDVCSLVFDLVEHAIEPVEMGHRYRDGAEFLFHLAPEYEGPLIEQDVSTRPVDVGEKYRLDQSMAIVEGGELHRFVLGGVHRDRKSVV